MDYSKLANDPNVSSLFIAEAGINHDGDLAKAMRMVDVAAQAGADYVKFQTFKAEKLVTPDALMSSYHDKGRHEGESFRALLQRLELDKESHITLRDHCQSKGIKFLSTAFDEESFDLLLELGTDVVKVASAELTNIPFLRYMAAAKLPMIVSTGMGTLGEIEEAVAAIVGEGNDQIVLMHCISWYPAEFNTSNLRFMKTLRDAFGFPVGYSDHTLGINMSIAARALGARIIEKHFTLDSRAFGPDHEASIEPVELVELVKSIRQVEAGLGSTARVFGEKELAQRGVHRRSLVVSKPVRQGEVFSKENLTVKRPGTGLKPKFWYDVIGKKASNDLRPEHVLSMSDIVF